MLLTRTPTSKEQKGYTYVMHRIPPSQKMRKQTEELLNGGADGEADVTSVIIRLGIERVVEETWRKPCLSRIKGYTTRSG